jgi:hypothetical protein
MPEQRLRLKVGIIIESDRDLADIDSEFQKITPLIEEQIKGIIRSKLKPLLSSNEKIIGWKFGYIDHSEEQDEPKVV